MMAEGFGLKKAEDPQETRAKWIEFRLRQSRASRLSEYITGMRPDDPRMVDRLIQDQNILRSKYRLPAREVQVVSPSEYERTLRARAKKIGVAIRDKLECG